MNRTPRRYDGTRVKLVMDMQGRRNDWLAKQLGLPEYTITRYFNGTTAIPVERADQIALALGVPIDLLFGFYESNVMNSDIESSEVS